MGEIGCNGTDFRASLQIQSWGESPQPLLPGASGDGLACTREDSSGRTAIPFKSRN